MMSRLTSRQDVHADTRALDLSTFSDSEGRVAGQTPLSEKHMPERMSHSLIYPAHVLESRIHRTIMDTPNSRAGAEESESRYSSAQTVIRSKSWMTWMDGNSADESAKGCQSWL